MGDLADVAIPDSLRGLVAARLDLLPAAERSLSRTRPCWASAFTATGWRR